MASRTKESATFVFRGKVKRTGTARLEAVTDIGPTATVTVSEIVRSPPALAGFVGHDVTVRLADGERVAMGSEAFFYVTGFVFGEHLTVQSLGHDAVASARTAVAASARAAGGDPTLAFRQTRARQRAEQAPVVLTGKVVAVGLANSEPTARTAASVTPSRVSEHEPFWREAVVAVHAVHKGAMPKQEFVLRFPGSSDVRWHRSPKFQAGQEGVFSLHPDQVSNNARFGLAAGSLASDASAFTALSSADFQPADHEAEVAAAVSAAQSVASA
jgi:hypothetical protein